MRIYAFKTLDVCDYLGVHNLMCSILQDVHQTVYLLYKWELHFEILTILSF